MICNTCLPIFAFDDTETISSTKKGLLERVRVKNISAKDTRILQEDYEAYKKAAADFKENKALLPCPWSVNKILADPQNLLDTGAAFINAGSKRTWRAVEDSAKNTACDLCRSMVAIVHSTRGQSWPKDDDVIETLWAIQGNIPEQLRFSVLRGDDEVLEFDYDCAVEDTEGTFTSTLTIPQAHSTNDDACFSALATALARCRNEHPDCQRGKNETPTRLIDVQPQEGDIDVIRLVGKETAGPNVDYATLSHVWGGKVPSQLTLENSEEMFRGFSVQSLSSKVFRDAIVATRRLGLRYLWIDSLW
jgi:hypothetical protein